MIIIKKFIAVVLFSVSSVCSAVSLHQVVVFGDSLSDNGNLYEYMQHQLPPSPPYFQGRFSNGPVWVEHLLRAYFPISPETHLLDYAFGGAGVAVESADDMLFTLDHEIDSYLLSHLDKADENSLFVVWIGANNYLGLPEAGLKTVDQVNLGIKQSLQRLSSLGAKHILVFNLPDLGRSPMAKLMSSEEELTHYSVLHNQALLATITELQQTHPQTQWLHYDVNAMLNSVLAAPTQFGFNNVDETCQLMTLRPAAMDQHTMIKMATRGHLETLSDHCEGYLFFDPIHPASRAHEIMAANVQQLLSRAGIELS